MGLHLAVYNRWTDGLDWTGLEWNGLDWTGLEWNGLDWNCYLASLKLSCVCDARDYSHAVYGANDTTQSLFYRITCSLLKIETTKSGVNSIVP